MAFVLYWLMFFGAKAISRFYKQPELVPVIRVLSLSLPFYAFNSIQRAYISKYMLFQRLFYSSLGAIVLSGGVGIYMAYQGYGVWALVGQNISSQIVTTLIMWFTVRWRPIAQFSLDRFKGLFSYGWKIFGANFITTLFVNIRKLVIGRYFTADSLAYYEKGEQLPSLVMSNIFTSIQTILLPTFSDSQDDRQRVKAMMRRSTKLSCFFIYPIMVGMIVAAKPLVVFLLTEKWISVVPFVQILCIANFFRPITISNWEAIKALGYSNITLKLEVVKKFVDISILIVSVLLGVYAIAWGCVLFNFLCVFINLYPNKKLLNYGIKEQVADAVPILLIALGMGLVVYWIQFFQLPNLYILLLQFFTGGMIYIGLSRVFKDESLMYLTQLFKDNKKRFHIKSSE
jgi:O-antigen/teichoic acid export membrane protein